MSKYEFLIETIYQEVVEVEADSLEDAEDIVLMGEGSQVDMLNVSNIIIDTRTLEEHEDTSVLPALELDDA